MLFFGVPAWFGNSDPGPKDTTRDLSYQLHNFADEMSSNSTPRNGVSAVPDLSKASAEVLEIEVSHKGGAPKKRSQYTMIILVIRTPQKDPSFSGNYPIRSLTDCEGVQQNRAQRLFKVLLLLNVMGDLPNLVPLIQL